MPKLSIGRHRLEISTYVRSNSILSVPLHGANLQMEITPGS